MTMLNLEDVVAHPVAETSLADIAPLILPIGFGAFVVAALLATAVRAAVRRF